LTFKLRLFFLALEFKALRCFIGLLEPDTKIRTARFSYALLLCWGIWLYPSRPW